MSFIVNHGSLRSFNYNWKDRKEIGPPESVRRSSTSCHELPFDGIAVSCKWGPCVDFSAQNAGNLNSGSRIWKASLQNDTGEGSLLLRSRRGEKGGAFLKGRIVRGLGLGPDAKLSVDRRKEHHRKRGRRKPGLKADDVRVSKGYWRLFGVEVPLDKDLGKDNISLSDAVLEAIALALKCPDAQLPKSPFSVVRKSLDARKIPRFVYTIDVDVEKFVQCEPKAKAILSLLRDMPGKTEFTPSQRIPLDLVARLRDLKADDAQAGGGSRDLESSSTSSTGFLCRGAVSSSQELRNASSSTLGGSSTVKKAKVVVVGSGPAGLFAALSLAETNAEVVLVERGQPVESRGRDIGALIVRRILDPNSNLCFGEGGAGTWSDGKLTTRIGKNGSSVQTVSTLGLMVLMLISYWVACNRRSYLDDVIKSPMQIRNGKIYSIIISIPVCLTIKESKCFKPNS